MRSTAGLGPGKMEQGCRLLADCRVLQDFVSHLAEGIYITSADGRILDANPAFLRMLGVSSLAQLEGITAAQLLVDPRRREEELAILAREGSVREFELEIRRPDGGVRTVLDTAFQRVDPHTGEVRYHGILVDITERKGLERELAALALRDALTGCYNRRFLAQRERQLQGDGGPWGVIVVDVDRFKHINDRLGHDAGDQVLVQLAGFLQAAVGPQDAVIRMGGDEFLILLEGAAAASTEEVARRLRAAAPASAPATFTLGWAVRAGRESLQETIRRADRLLIWVRGRDRGPAAPGAPGGAPPRP